MSLVVVIRLSLCFFLFLSSLFWVLHFYNTWGVAGRWKGSEGKFPLLLPPASLFSSPPLFN